LLHCFYFIPFVHIHTKQQYYVEHNENKPLGSRGEAEGRGEQKRWREGRKEVMEQRQEGLRKYFVTKTEHM
jgi:hypothetical protein